MQSNNPERNLAPEINMYDIDPFGDHKFKDKIDKVLEDLREEHLRCLRRYKAPPLPLNDLLPKLAELFERKTFNELLRECTEASWSDRLRGGFLVKKVLEAYKNNVADFGTPEQKALYAELLKEVDGYCMEMTAGLFTKEADLTSARVEKYVDKAEDFEEFRKHLDRFKIEKDKLPEDTIKRCDVRFNKIRKLRNRLIAAERLKDNPWLSGSFYLFVIIAVVALLLVAAKVVDPLVVPIVIIGALLLASIVVAFQLKQDRGLSEESFLSLITLALTTAKDKFATTLVSEQKEKA